jgi:hypothetical protein
MKSVKVLGRYLRYASYLILFFTLLSLLQTQVFNLREADPFNGSKWHNPYAAIMSSEVPWQKGNFHTHGKNFGGLSNGHGSDLEIVSTYLDSLGYDWAAVSNYQKVNKEIRHKGVIPAYEHGIGLGKQHQLVIGENNVSWFDFPFVQFLNQKQTTISRLQKPHNLVAIAHPKLRGAYSLDDMRYLSGYDCMEVLNHIGRSREHWDAALSAGLPIYLISSDDSHNYKDLGKSGQNITVFKTEDQSTAGIINAIKNGQAFGIDLRSGSRNMQVRKSEIAQVALPTKFELEGDSLKVAFSQVANWIKFVGQNGEIKKQITHANHAAYPLKENDTYIRLVAEFSQPGAHLYFNPVFRYEDQLPLNVLPTVNARQTRLYRLSILYLIVGLFGLVWRVEFARKQKAAAKIKWAIS